MNTFNSFSNFGSVTDQLTTVTVTPTIAKPVSPAVPTPDNGTHKWYDIVGGLVKTTTDLTTSAANAVSAVKTTSSGTPGYNSNIPAQPPAPVKSNTGMYVILTASALALVGIGIVVLKKKKKA